MTIEDKAPQLDEHPAGSAHWYTRFREWVRSRYIPFREQVRSRPGVDLTYRLAVAVVGTVVLIGGLAAIPYPGPGWLIVFAGLAILGTEFIWAQRVLRFLRHRYDRWTAWLRGQPRGVRLMMMFLTGIIVLLTLWLVNALGIVAGWLQLPWAWVRSPLT
ncbi:MAG: TIGR02611 family protein [Pseudonocardiaceae bacterium]